MAIYIQASFQTVNVQNQTIAWQKCQRKKSIFNFSFLDIVQWTSQQTEDFQSIHLNTPSTDKGKYPNPLFMGA